MKRVATELQDTFSFGADPTSAQRQDVFVDSIKIV